VIDLKVHQNFAGHDRSGIVRAGTYGRGIFELTQLPPPRQIEKPPITLSVQAVLRDEDGAPSPVSARMPVSMKDQKATRETPFDFPTIAGAEVALEAPAEIEEEEGVLKFTGWAIPGKRSVRSNKTTVKLNEAATATAYYEMEKRKPNPKAKPLHISVSTEVQQICEPGYTHKLKLAWDTIDGQRPVTVRAEITYPDRHIESMEFKPSEGFQPFPINYPQGGEVKVKVIARDFTGQSSSATSTVELQPCR